MSEEKSTIDKRTELQKEAFFRARQSGVLREIAIARGGTGEKRQGISDEEFNKRKSKRKQARKSRQINSKKG